MVDELDSARALNNEYLKQHPDEVAHFLDGRSSAETGLLIATASPAAASQILERLNPRVAGEALLRFSLDVRAGSSPR